MTTNIIADTKQRRPIVFSRADVVRFADDRREVPVHQKHAFWPVEVNYILFKLYILKLNTTHIHKLVLFFYTFFLV